jgi:hypothetical protein
VEAVTRHPARRKNFQRKAESDAKMGKKKCKPVTLGARLSRISLLQKLGIFAVAGIGTIYMTYLLSAGTCGNSCMPGCPPPPCPCPDLCGRKKETDADRKKGCSCAMNPCACYPPVIKIPKRTWD